MASVNMSSDEGEIVEAPSQPRSDQSRDVDRPGRHQGPSSRSPAAGPDHPSSRASPTVPNDRLRRRSRSPRGFKRSRDGREMRDRDRDRDRDGERDPRHFRIHYEDRDEPRHAVAAFDDRRGSGGDVNGRRDVLPSRPSAASRYAHNADRRRYDDYLPDKRPRWRSRSPPPGRRPRDRDPDRDRSRFVPEMYPSDQNKYSAQLERRSQQDPVSSRAHAVDAPITSREEAKFVQGVFREKGTRNSVNGPANPESRNGHRQSAAAREPEPEVDWDAASSVDKEAAVEAEIQRRRRAREEAYKRVLGGSTPGTPALQPAVDRQTSTIASQKPKHNTPRSNGASSPALSGAGGGQEAQDGLSPAVIDFANDKELINTHGQAKASEEDGPPAADYDPTEDMQEDGRRDELRHGHVGDVGDLRATYHDGAGTDKPHDGRGKYEKDDDDDGFDMFAEDFDEKKFAAPSAPKPDPEEAPALANAAGGGILEGDDKDGYYKIRPGELLDGRYQISTTVGRGMFSGVARAVDVATKKTVAIKIMRNNDALRKGGFTEIAILQKLNAADPDNKKHLIKFERSFEYKGHLCMAFENLSMNLREVLKKFGNNVGINLNATRAYAYQIFLALGHMRKCSIIHADLKPDNILVNENRNVLKICDLGTAIDRSDAATASTEIAPYLVSRFYRAPEIILGMPYDYAIDMWSIGCTLYELYTGKILFTGDSNNQMLKNIMEIRGKLSSKLYRRGQLSNIHFDEVGNFLSVERDKVLGKTTMKTLTIVKPTRDLRTRLLAASSGMTDAEAREFNHFVDLLERCLTLNPDKRITPSEALRHPFFLHRLPSLVR